MKVNKFIFSIYKEKDAYSIISDEYEGLVGAAYSKKEINKSVKEIVCLYENDFSPRTEKIQSGFVQKLVAVKTPNGQIIIREIE